MEQAFPVLAEMLSFRRVNARARKGVGIGPARLVLRYNVLFTFFFCIKCILWNAAYGKHDKEARSQSIFTVSCHYTIHN